jgi:hypothetical protein
LKNIEGIYDSHAINDVGLTATSVPDSGYAALGNRVHLSVASAIELKQPRASQSGLKLSDIIIARDSGWVDFVQVIHRSGKLGADQKQVIGQRLPARHGADHAAWSVAG